MQSSVSCGKYNKCFDKNGNALEFNIISYTRAKIACEKWHYSKKVPGATIFRVGIWENNIFIGVVLFGAGANRNMLPQYGLNQNQGCELTRVALNKHKTFTSQIIMNSIKLLKKYHPEFQLIVSYADEKQNHLGKIYQATNWIYVGKSIQKDILWNGKLIHKKSLFSRFGTNSVEKLKIKGYDVKWADSAIKHKYLIPLNKKMRKKLLSLSLPYPKIIESDYQFNREEEKSIENLLFC